MLIPKEVKNLQISKDCLVDVNFIYF